MSIHEAAALMGVSTATLRRWSDAGTILAFTTPGGHRRFSRTAIAGLLPAIGANDTDRRQLDRLREGLLRQVRHGWRQILADAPWSARLDEADRSTIAELGRRLTDGILAELDVGAVDRPERIRVARRSAAASGALAARRGIGLRAIMDAALRLQSVIVHEVASTARRLELDSTTTCYWLETTTCTLDALMADAMRGHEQIVESIEERSRPAAVPR